MRVKYEKQALREAITLSAPGPEIHTLANVPAIYPGDAILPRGVGFFFQSADCTTAAPGLTRMLFGLTPKDQEAPADIYDTDRLYGLAGFSYHAAAAGEGLPEIMAARDVEPLPMGLPVYPSLGNMHVVSQYDNITKVGALQVMVILAYDVVTLTTAEQARLAY